MTSSAVSEPRARPLDQQVLERFSSGRSPAGPTALDEPRSAGSCLLLLDRSTSQGTNRPVASIAVSWACSSSTPA